MDIVISLKSAALKQLTYYNTTQDTNAKSDKWRLKENKSCNVPKK